MGRRTRPNMWRQWPVHIRWAISTPVRRSCFQLCQTRLTRQTCHDELNMRLEHDCARFPTNGKPNAVAVICIPTSGYFHIPSHGIAFELATDQPAHDCTSHFVTTYLHPQNF